MFLILFRLNHQSFFFSEVQGEEIDTEAAFAALEKQFADKKAVS